MYNKVVLVGRLTRDPELRYTPQGHPVASFSLAVNRPYKNENGVQDTDFIDIVVWRRLAEQAAQYLSKGRMVLAEGRLQIRSFETAEGQKRRIAEVVATAIRFLPDGRTKNGKGAEEEACEPPAEPEVVEEDVPF